MLLAIDIGNTNIVIGCIRDGEILFEARIATNHLQTSDQYAVEIRNILKLFEMDLHKVQDSIISSVVPPVFNSVCTAIIKLTQKQPIVVGPGIKTGLDIRMDNPAQVGSDLIVDAVAAFHDYPTPLIVIDMGTATTMSLVGRGNVYLGGPIIPGLRVSLDALSSSAAQLFGISLEKPQRVIGKNTIECMRSGIMYGHASMIDGMIDRMQEELGEPIASVIATGGTSQFVVPLCRHKIIYDKDLLLKGLAILYNNELQHTARSERK
ncbi:MAG: type III pantothenate kinase [Clostridiales bacterium]|nr:type III pantothenate kinase [Clostridiales bacterium]